MHLVDTTLFYSPTSGGVRRYLNAKHEWYSQNHFWRHSLLVPSEHTALVPGGVSTIAGTHVPGTFNYRLPLTPRRWTQLLDELAPDFIEVGDAFHPAWSAVNVATRRGIPAAAFFHSHLPRIIGKRCGNTLFNTAGRYLRWLYEQFDIVLAPSRVMCDYLRSLGLTSVALQPLGVDAEIFHPSQRTETLRAELGLPANKRLLAYAGRFSAEKNIPVLHEAMALLGSDYHLLMIGGGEQQQPAANISVLPYQTQSAALARILASADALVHAGTAETFGLVVLEAMACGRPVVGMKAGAIAELVDEQVGIAATAATGANFAQAVRDLYDRDLNALGQAARARVQAQYTWDQALLHQQAIYTSLIEKKHSLPESWATASRLPSGDQQIMPAGPSSS